MNKDLAHRTMNEVNDSVRQARRARTARTANEGTPCFEAS
jgi:hypothetical protein